MPTPKELEQRFWKLLQSERTMMLGLDGVEDGHARPMTANILAPDKPVWFFTSQENDIVRKLGKSDRAIASFTARDHTLFATVHGRLSLDTSRETIDRLWNAHIAAWYEGGKSDPRLRLLRLDPEKAEIWENASSMVAGIKMLFGIDPKDDYKDKVAQVSLR